jgi:hypothetical protein
VQHQREAVAAAARARVWRVVNHATRTSKLLRLRARAASVIWPRKAQSACAPALASPRRGGTQTQW